MSINIILGALKCISIRGLWIKHKHSRGVNPSSMGPDS